jgi:hypothetical protein
MTDDSGKPAPKSSETSPPAANQGNDEPVATTPDESAQSGSPDDAPEDEDQLDQATRSGASDIPESATGGVPTPGDSHGVAVPAVQAAAGSSEEAQPLQGVPIPANAPPGKPDGEVDTRA